MTRLSELTKTLLFVDEVGAIVFDIGAHSVRAGYAGEDCPKVKRLCVIYQLLRAFSSRRKRLGFSLLLMIRGKELCGYRLLLLDYHFVESKLKENKHI